MMLLSFFEVVDVLPYVENAEILVDGNVVEITEYQQEKLQEQIPLLFDGSHTLPAFGVITDEMYREEVQNGTYVSLKFGAPVEINGLPFDELVFKIEPGLQSFDLYRGMKGVFQGRCIYVDLMNKDMTEFYEFAMSIPAVGKDA
ncbi:MAG: hypothetical protein J6K39_03820 [Clostridia bacterium]|nr:hypothetical protein [Clostridia bacterium]